MRFLAGFYRGLAVCCWVLYGLCVLKKQALLLGSRASLGFRV